MHSCSVPVVSFIVGDQSPCLRMTWTIRIQLHSDEMMPWKHGVQALLQGFVHLYSSMVSGSEASLFFCPLWHCQNTCWCRKAEWLSKYTKSTLVPWVSCRGNQVPVGMLKTALELWGRCWMHYFTVVIADLVLWMRNLLTKSLKPPKRCSQLWCYAVPHISMNKLP